MSNKDAKFETVLRLLEVASIWELLHIPHLASSKDSAGTNKGPSTDAGPRHGQMLVQLSSSTAMPDPLHQGDRPPAGKQFSWQDSSNCLTAGASTGASAGPGSCRPLRRLGCAAALRSSIPENHKGQSMSRATLCRNPGGQFVSRKHTVPICHLGTALDTLLVSSGASYTGSVVSETRGG